MLCGIQCVCGMLQFRKVASISVGGYVVPRQSGRAIALLRRFRVLKGMLVPMFACMFAGAATLGQKAHSPAGCRLPAATLYACMHRVLCEARMSHDCNHEVFHYAYWLSTALPPLRQLARNTTLSAFYLCTLYGVGCLHYLFWRYAKNAVRRWRRKHCIILGNLPCAAVYFVERLENWLKLLPTANWSTLRNVPKRTAMCLWHTRRSGNVPQAFLCLLATYVTVKYRRKCT